MWKALGAAALGAAIVLAGVAYGSRYAGKFIDNTPTPQVLPFAAIGSGYTKHVYKFGHNTAVGTNWEDVWDGGGNYSWLTSAITMQVSSSSTADTGAGTGCRTVTFQGLDSDYLEISDTVTTTGQSASTGSKQFYRVFRAWCETNGSGGLNAGTIYISDAGASLSSGVPSDATKIRAAIGVTNGQTLMSIYTIPAGYNGQLLNFSVGSDDDTKATTFQLLTRVVGQGWRVKWEGVTNGTMFHDEIGVPFIFPPKTDIRVRAKSESATTAGVANLEIGMR